MPKQRSSVPCKSPPSSSFLSHGAIHDTGLILNDGNKSGNVVRSSLQSYRRASQGGDDDPQTTNRRNSHGAAAKGRRFSTGVGGRGNIAFTNEQQHLSEKDADNDETAQLLYDMQAPGIVLVDEGSHTGIGMDNICYLLSSSPSHICTYTCCRPNAIICQYAPISRHDPVASHNPLLSEPLRLIMHAVGIVGGAANFYRPSEQEIAEARENNENMRRQSVAGVSRRRESILSATAKRSSPDNNWNSPPGGGAALRGRRQSVADSMKNFIMGQKRTSKP